MPEIHIMAEEAGLTRCGKTILIGGDAGTHTVRRFSRHPEEMVAATCPRCIATLPPDAKAAETALSLSSDKETVLTAISDLVSDFLYYDRKEDEDLTMGAIEALVEKGELTVDEMVARFREELEKHFDGDGEEDDEDEEDDDDEEEEG